jgi:hypothetical protein
MIRECAWISALRILLLIIMLESVSRRVQQLPIFMEMTLITCASKPAPALLISMQITQQDCVYQIVRSLKPHLLIP